MKIRETLIFSLATAFFLIALHQSMKHGIATSYWLYMISIGLLLWYKMRKDKNKTANKS